MGRPHRVLVMLLLCVAAATIAAADATSTPPTTIRAKHDRRLGRPDSGATDRAQKALELQRSMERNFAPAAADDGSPSSQAEAEGAVPAPEIAPLAALLLGLIGGLAGGGAALAGWLAATARRTRRAASTA